jgi:DNA-directed RNA polymerase specialized sigma24 family protein
MSGIEQACVDYWPALYGFLRRSGKSRPEAEDLIQGFLVQCLLRKTRLGSPALAKGGFRIGLLKSLRDYVISRPAKTNHDPHAPGNKPVPADSFDEAEKTLEEYREVESPNQLFLKMWCRIAPERAMRQLREHYVGLKQAALFAALQPQLFDSGQQGELRTLAASLRRSEEGVRVALLWMRQEYVRLLREEVGDGKNLMIYL